MSQRAPETYDSPEGLFFCPKIETVADLNDAELTLWLGRGVWSGKTDEERQAGQDKLIEKRRRLVGDIALGQTGII